MKFSRRAIFFAGITTTGAYFALAYYFKVSHVEDAPHRDDVAVIYRIIPTATPGTFFAHMWLPNHVTKVVVYENGISIGAANAVYDDPSRTYSFNGRRWKYVEFNTEGRHARRWVIFKGSGAATSEPES